MRIGLDRLQTGPNLLISQRRLSEVEVCKLLNPRFGYTGNSIRSTYCWNNCSRAACIIFILEMAGCKFQEFPALFVCEGTFARECVCDFKVCSLLATLYS